MLDNITFVDLISLIKITPDATVERFGSMINSSFFDASNILGTLKQKGLVDFVTAFPSQSALTVSEQGKQLIADVEAKATTPFDTLDMSILLQLSGGKRNLPDLSGALNITSKDLAFHLYKLATQQYMSYELRNGTVNLLLTEKGFLCVKQGMPKPEMQQQVQAPQPVVQQQAQPQQQAPGQVQQPMPEPAPQIGPQPEAPMQPQKTDEELKLMQSEIAAKKRTKELAIAFIILVIVAILAYLYFFTTLI